MKKIIALIILANAMFAQQSPKGVGTIIKIYDAKGNDYKGQKVSPGDIVFMRAKVMTDGYSVNYSKSRLGLTLDDRSVPSIENPYQSYVLNDTVMAQLKSSKDTFYVSFIIPELPIADGHYLGMGITLDLACNMIRSITGCGFEKRLGMNLGVYNRNAVGVVDDMIAEHGKLLYCLDLAGRVVAPRGFCIAVFENGRREKVVFD